MNTEADLQRCLTFINCQLQPAHKPGLPASNGTAWRAVTISRQAGSGAHLVAEYLADYLQTQSPGGAQAWEVFDRNLVEEVLKDHHLPSRLAAFMPEDRISEASDTLEELFGLHPPTWTLVRKTAETVLRLAQLGKVILIGRGANVITSRLHDVFHVRLVGSLEQRVALVQTSRRLGKEAARKLVHDEDRGRHRYLKKYFDADIDDPLLYHLVINTDLVGHRPAAVLIGHAVIKSHPAEFTSRAAW